MSQTNMVTLACEHRWISGFCLRLPKNTGNAIATCKKMLIRSLQFEKLMLRMKISLIYNLPNKEFGKSSGFTRFVDSEFYRRHAGVLLTFSARGQLVFTGRQNFFTCTFTLYKD